MSKEGLLELWRDIRARTSLAVDEGVRVETIAAHGPMWQVVGTNGYARRAANVVLALGRRGAPNTLGVPGEDLPNVAYRLLEPDVFAGKRVLVVGGGNAAADCAIALAESRLCRSVAISYRRAELARLRTTVREAMDRMLRSGSIAAHLSTVVVQIAADRVRLRRADGAEYDLPNDEVIIQIGGQPPSELLRTIGIELVEKRGAA
jgi:thioredoxin reductase